MFTNLQEGILLIPKRHEMATVISLVSNRQQRDPLTRRGRGRLLHATILASLFCARYI